MGGGGGLVGCSKRSPLRGRVFLGGGGRGGAVNNNSVGLSFIPKKAMDADRDTAQNRARLNIKKKKPSTVKINKPIKPSLGFNTVQTEFGYI